MDKIIETLREKLIVSCQALADEPLHSSFIMGKMALAAAEGGAAGIRANSKEDIEEIKKNVNLPVIGIVKRDYPDSEIYITPTMKEIDELMEVSPEIIAVDATDRARPAGLSLDAFYGEIRRKYPNQLLMADCSTLDEALHADALGFDFIGTTLVGYTPASEGVDVSDNDFRVLREFLKHVKGKVICEGKIDTPEKASEVLKIGAYAVVVGAAITRPQVITKRFVEAINQPWRCAL
ncbi:MAG: N-acetylmannosamine-6-phosphate 2-epimerase [Faecousia sp.]